MAEINVPAWPIPIHQTKLTIAKPQSTGILMPQMPTPRQQVATDRHEQHMVITNGNTKADKPRRCRARSSTSRAIFSVTEA